MTVNVNSKPHYPHLTRRVLELFAHGMLTNVQSIDVEPDYGYIMRLKYSNGSFRVLHGTNLGLNPGAATHLATDKGYTKFMLRTLGINCPAGAEFLLPWWHNRIGKFQLKHGNTQMRTIADMPEYIERHSGYPVYVKPVDGSGGRNVFFVQSQKELETVVEMYNDERVRVAVVEAPIPFPDYRVVSLDGRLIAAYQRIPLTVVGDGEHTIRELLDDLQRMYESRGQTMPIEVNDMRLQAYMAQHDLGEDTVPASGEKVVLASISNLSAGGSSQDVTSVIHERWANLAAEIAKNFSLRLIGLDLACADITSPDADYSVIEVNASPGLDHYASSGETQRKIVDELYMQVLNEFPGR